MDGIVCNGDESSLATCAVDTTAGAESGSGASGHALVTCERREKCEAPGAWRLIDAYERSTSDRWGTLQTRSTDGYRGCYCMPRNMLTKGTADIICMQLGFGQAGGPIASFVFLSSPLGRLPRGYQDYLR